MSGGLIVTYAHGWLSARASVATDIADNEQGTLARVDLLGRYRPGARWTVSAGPGLTWGNDRYMRTFFGVDSVQRARSGLSGFRATRGVERVRFSLRVNYRVDRHWGLATSGWVARLQGAAAASPITEDRSMRYLGVFVMYRFGKASPPTSGE